MQVYASKKMESHFEFCSGPVFEAGSGFCSALADISYESSQRYSPPYLGNLFHWALRRPLANKTGPVHIQLLPETAIWPNNSSQLFHMRYGFTCGHCRCRHEISTHDGGASADALMTVDLLSDGQIKQRPKDARLALTSTLLLSFCANAEEMKLVVVSRCLRISTCGRSAMGKWSVCSGVIEVGSVGRHSTTEMT